MKYICPECGFKFNVLGNGECVACSIDKGKKVILVPQKENGQPEIENQQHDVNIFRKCDCGKIMKVSEVVYRCECGKKETFK